MYMFSLNIVIYVRIMLTNPNRLILRVHLASMHGFLIAKTAAWRDLR